MKTVLNILALAALIIPAALQAQTAAGWHVETVSSEGDVGQYSSLEIDSQGNPHISFYNATNGDLVFAKSGGGQWVSTLVYGEGDTGQFSSMALVSDIAYFTFFKDNPTGTSDPIAFWKMPLETMTPVSVSNLEANSTGSRGKSLIRSGPNGLLAITYQNSGAATACPAQLDTYDIDDDANVAETSDDGVIFFKTWSGGNYNDDCTNVTPARLKPTQFGLAVDKDGYIHAAYSWVTSYGNIGLTYRRSVSNTTPFSFFGTGSVARYKQIVHSSELADQVQQSMAVDASNNFHIVYSQPVAKDLMYASADPADSGKLAVAPIDDAGDVGRFPAIAVCPDNSLHVSYYDETNQALKLARKGSAETAWSLATLDDGADPADRGQFTSIQCDPQGYLHISYYDVEAGNLKYATNKPICGDGVLAGSEQCDDGNTDNTDACLDSCQSAGCGDSFVQGGAEACDDGNTVDDDNCRNSCALPACGDNILQADEQCDDGNPNSGDGCSDSCQTELTEEGAVCGNGTCDSGETNADCPGDCAVTPAENPAPGEEPIQPLEAAGGGGCSLIPLSN